MSIKQVVVVGQFKNRFSQFKDNMRETILYGHASSILKVKI